MPVYQTYDPPIGGGPIAEPTPPPPPPPSDSPTSAPIGGRRWRARIVTAIGCALIILLLLACAGDGCSSANDGTQYQSQCH